jgi:hypothetical protein
MTSRSRARRAGAGGLLLAVAMLVPACAPTVAAQPLDQPLDRPGTARAGGTPFAGLTACGDQPFVAVLRGFTVEGRLVEKPGSSPSSDIYGVRPDGSVSPVTTDLGSYEFGITDDAATVYASPYPAPAPAAAALTAASDRVVAITPATGQQTVVLEAPDVGAVAPAPDGSRLGLTVFTASGAPDVGTSAPAVVDLGGATTPRSLAAPATSSRTAQVAVATRELAWSPDGRMLASVATLPDATQEVQVADATTGASTTLHRVDDATALLSLDWSPDGTTLLTVEGRAPSGSGRSRDRVVEIDVATGRSTVVLQGVGGDPVYSAADGSRLTMLDDGPGESPVARTWTRRAGGRFVATSVAEIGAEVGLVGADRLDIPRCALP